MTGVILSGGECRRMGFNKALIKINGERLIDRTVRIFKNLFPEVILITNESIAFLDLDVKIASDIILGKGPLGGIFTGLFYATHTHAFVSAYDMPFTNPDLISHMVACTANYDIVVPLTPEGFQPLHAIYARACKSEVRRLINKDLLKINSLYKDLHTRILEPDEVSNYNTEGKVFFNINTRQDITEMGILI
jgi:molybdopterin-guanine dinucleotide biosynthesis protein A